MWGELCMPQNLRDHRTPVWRKIATLVLLPAIILLWMTGWILTQMGSQEAFTEIRQKTDRTYPEFQANEDTKIPEDNEDSQIAHNPEIIA